MEDGVVCKNTYALAADVTYDDLLKFWEAAMVSDLSLEHPIVRAAGSLLNGLITHDEDLHNLLEKEYNGG